MVSHTQKGSVAVDAYQWPGGTTTTTSFTAGTGVATWLKALSLHTPGDGTLHVPCWNGTRHVNPTDWIVRHPDNTVDVMTTAQFTAYFS